MNKDIFCKGYTWGFFSKRGDFQTEAAEKSKACFKRLELDMYPCKRIAGELCEHKSFQ